jgi:S1-C subfamily serine protease
MRKHHKIILGGFSTIVVAFMVITGILLNGLIVKQQINHNEVIDKIDNLQIDTQSKLNELTESLMDTKVEVDTLNNKVGVIDKEFETLKDSVSEDFSNIIDNSIPSVVTIKTDISQGTGFIISDDGFVITNAHILSGGKRVETMNYEQRIFRTTFIGYNSDLDLALLKISGTFEPLELSDSDSVHVGQEVVAIGNPLGLQFSVSQGIVSGVHRQGPNGLDIYIQTDAALNPGNSGGPLINSQGKVIGINNFKSASGESLGFALESNQIKQIVNEISQETLNVSVLD